MKILVGLGNIGEKYLTTRHNVGFIVLDQFAKELEEEGIEITWKEETKLKAIIAKVHYKNEILVLVKPITLMNNSGQAVSQILNFYKDTRENIIVIYDDIDLPLGTIRFREKGSAGTHNGMRSIIQELGTEDFKRLRIGIESRGEFTPQQQDLSSFVLSNFIEKEHALLENSIKEALKELKNHL